MQYIVNILNCNIYKSRCILYQCSKILHLGLVMANFAAKQVLRTPTTYRRNSLSHCNQLPKCDSLTDAPPCKRASGETAILQTTNFAKEFCTLAVFAQNLRYTQPCVECYS